MSIEKLELNEQLPSVRDKKISTAERAVCAECPAIFDLCDRELEENPVFSRNGKECSIESPKDALYARAQAYYHALETIKKEAEDKDDYYKAKCAARFAQGFQSISELIVAYRGEVEENGPLAQLLKTLVEDVRDAGRDSSFILKDVA